jgi:hypothetical protein
MQAYVWNLACHDYARIMLLMAQMTSSSHVTVGLAVLFSCVTVRSSWAVTKSPLFKAIYGAVSIFKCADGDTAFLQNIGFYQLVHVAT